MGPKFTLHAGTYRFYVDRKLVYSAKEIAVVVNKETWTLYKHGPTELVSASFNELRSIHGDNVFMLVSSTWRTEDLESLVNITGYAQTLMKEFIGDNEVS